LFSAANRPDGTGPHGIAQDWSDMGNGRADANVPCRDPTGWLGSSALVRTFRRRAETKADKPRQPGAGLYNA